MTFESIMNSLVWAAIMQGYVVTGTYAEIGYLMHEDRCQDFDLVCAEEQPKSVKGFVSDYLDYCRSNRWATIKEYYDTL